MCESYIRKLVHDYNWYIMNRAINSIGSFLDNKSYEIVFDFYGRTLLGQQNQNRDGNVLCLLFNSYLVNYLDVVMLETYFPEESKKKCLDMVNDLKNALEEKLPDLEWMTPETKEKALLKLHKFGVKIGYPDKWRDFSQLFCNKDASYLECVLTCREFNFYWGYSHLDLPVDRTKWEMNPQELMHL